MGCPSGVSISSDSSSNNGLRRSHQKPTASEASGVWLCRSLDRCFEEYAGCRRCRCQTGPERPALQPLEASGNVLHGHSRVARHGRANKGRGMTRAARSSCAWGVEKATINSLKGGANCRFGSAGNRIGLRQRKERREERGGEEERMGEVVFEEIGRLWDLGARAPRLTRTL